MGCASPCRSKRNGDAQKIGQETTIETNYPELSDAGRLTDARQRIPLMQPLQALRFREAGSYRF